MRTTDAFLNAHLVDSFVFHIDGRLWPVSIRDQMIRGRLIVDRAVDQGLIHTDRDLAVVGGGAAGVTAALRAAELGVKVWLFEKDALFSRHALCVTRWVDPTQYDWRLGHWDAAAFPWPGTPAMPLAWARPDFAHALALDWQAQFALKLPRLRAFLTPMYPVEVTGYSTTAAPGSVRLHWQDQTGAAVHRDFGMVILALGFGNEKTSAPAPPHPPYSGFEFWSTDPFEQPNLGCATPPNVVISGGGDGSLQDFLRVTTRCRSAEELWRALPAGILPTIAEVQDAEDQSNRTFSWGPDTSGVWDCRALDRLHRVHDHLTDVVLRATRVQDTLDKLLRTDVAGVKVIHSCTHFGQSYSLNHFLALLVSKRLEAIRPAWKQVLLSGSSLAGVACVGHPTVSPAACHGQPHDITTAPKTSCSGRAGRPTRLGRFEVVVIRHGIDPIYLRANNGQGAPMPPLRQLLPYHMPD